MRKRSLSSSDFAMVVRRPPKMHNYPIQGSTAMEIGTALHGVLEKANAYGVTMTQSRFELRRYLSHEDGLVHHEVMEMGVHDSWKCESVRLAELKARLVITEVDGETALTCLECIAFHTPPRSKIDGT